MAYKSHIYMRGLIILCLILTGIREGPAGHVFYSDGENVTLPAKSHYDCTTTSWIYYREYYSEKDELVKDGKKKNDSERLSLGSDCSLNIEKATKDDYGCYNYQQNTKRVYFYGNVYLNFLEVSPPPTQTEIRPENSVTFSCHLYSYEGLVCMGAFIDEEFHLVWVNESGVDLQSDSRYQISFSREHCHSTLTTTLLKEDNNTEWRCQVTIGTEVRTSAGYTVNYLGNSTDRKIVGESLIRVILMVIEVVVVTAPTVILLRIICEKRANSRRRAQNSQMTDSQFQMSVLCPVEKN